MIILCYCFHVVLLHYVFTACKVWGKVLFSHMFVWLSLSRGSLSRQGGLCPEGLCLGKGLCLGVSVWEGGLCQGVSLTEMPYCTVKSRQYKSYWNAFLFTLNFYIIVFDIIFLKLYFCVLFLLSANKVRER